MIVLVMLKFNWFKKLDSLKQDLLQFFLLQLANCVLRCFIQFHVWKFPSLFDLPSPEFQSI